MKTITVDLIKDYIPFAGTHKDDWGMIRKFDGFKVKYFSGQRIYISIIKESMKLMEVVKKMEFNNDGNVYISFAKTKIKIGEYE